MSLLAETYYNRLNALGYTDENEFLRKLHMSLMEEDTEIYSGNIGRKGSVSADVVYFVDAKGTIGELTADEVVMVGDCDLTIKEIEADSVAVWAKKVKIGEGKIDELHYACDTFKCRAECDDKNKYGFGGKPYNLDAVKKQIKEDLARMADEIADDEDGDYGDIVVPGEFTSGAYGGTSKEVATHSPTMPIDIPEDVKLSMKIISALLSVDEVKASIRQALADEHDISDVVRWYVETGSDEEFMVLLSELPSQERAKAMAELKQFSSIIGSFDLSNATQWEDPSATDSTAEPIKSNNDAGSDVAERFCTSCGKKMSMQAKFCGKCGAPKV